MLDKQAEYFRTRSTSVLNESKALERLVDAEIRRVNEIMNDNKENKLTKGERDYER